MREFFRQTQWECEICQVWKTCSRYCTSLWFYPCLQRVKRLLLVDLRDDRWYGRGWSHQQRDKEDFPESERSLMKTRKSTGPKNTAFMNSSLDRKRRENYIKSHVLTAKGEEVCDPWVEIALDTKGRVWWAGRDARPHWKHAICRGRWLWSHVWQWGPPSIVGKTKVACPG